MKANDDAVRAIEAVYTARRRARGHAPESPEIRWIRRHMWATGATQKEMCDEIGMDQSFFSKILSGKRQITPLEIGRLVEIIGPFPIEELDDYYKAPKEAE